MGGGGWFSEIFLKILAILIVLIILLPKTDIEPESVASEQRLEVRSSGGGWGWAVSLISRITSDYLGFPLISGRLM